MKFSFRSRARRLRADVCTPVQLYLNVRDHYPETLLLESITGGKKPACSYICFDQLASFRISAGRLYTTFPNGERTSAPLTVNDTLQEKLNDFIQCITTEDAPAAHMNGLYGYMTYNAVQYMEQMELPVTEDIPDVCLGFYRYVLIYDHLKQELFLTERYNDSGPQDEAALLSLLYQPAAPVYPFRLTGEETAGCSEETFLEMAAAGRRHCYRGDVFQVVLSRIFSQPYKGDDFNVYRHLRTVSPSPYMFYADYGSFRLMGASPEAQLTISAGNAVLHPIAGTFRREENTYTDDALLEQALLQDPKENAEHIMLVDLARNDLARSYESVSVTAFREVKHFSHVSHITSEVTGCGLQPGKSNVDVLCSSFPAGTLSGAPKRRAIALIDQYEQHRRGFYGGCIGYLGFNGDVNMAIMIRSLLSHNNTLVYCAGAGIVAASDEQKELAEIDNKLRALRTAIINADNTIV